MRLGVVYRVSWLMVGGLLIMVEWGGGGEVGVCEGVRMWGGGW